MTSPEFKMRTLELQRRMADEKIDLALFTDPDSVYYLSAHWGDLGVEFGRPTLFAVPRQGEPTLITGGLEEEMARALTWVSNVRSYMDGHGGEWRDPVREVLNSKAKIRIGIEKQKIPAPVAEYLRAEMPADQLCDVSPVLGAMRVIKTPDEIAMLRQGGQVAVAMGKAGRATIGLGVPEYEVAIEILAAGSRKAAEIIGAEDPDSMMTPMIHNLQVLNSGHFTAMTHRRPTVRRLENGDPIYLCFCAICHFKHFKLGFDRQYFVGSVSDEMAKTYEVTIAAQRAAVDAMRPGVPAEDVNAAADEVYRSKGFSPSYRTGRAIGYSSLEQPELKRGDKTILQPGMVFAVDGGITVPGRYGARVGDTILVVDGGAECLTEFPRDLQVL